MDNFLSTLNPHFTYHFVLVHSENSHLTKITENKLIYKAVTKELLKYAHKAMDYNLSLLEQIKTKETR